MTSTFTWLDYSERERRRMLDVISLFEEKGTRDELGIGVVRDALADGLFPGINTIQTRARYFFFVPWIYLELERQRIPSRRIQQAARKAELDLVQPLIEAGEDQVFGSRAGRNLQRLPSSVYWNGLGAWGIRRFPGGQAEYHRQLDHFYARQEAYRAAHRGRRSGPDAASEDLDAEPHNWHPELPDPPPNFPQQATLALAEREADFLRERILMTAPGTYLAFLVELGLGDVETEFPWEHPWADETPDNVRTVLNHAENFSLCLHGAALLYNLMLAEKRQWTERIERYRAALAQWQGRMAQRADAINDWDRSDFWATVAAENPHVALGARRFINSWLDLVLASDPALVADDSQARRLVEAREVQLKRGLARLTNPRALELWGGSAGASRLNFRWPNVQTILRDIDHGLGRS